MQAAIDSLSSCVASVLSLAYSAAGSACQLRFGASLIMPELCATLRAPCMLAAQRGTARFAFVAKEINAEVRLNCWDDCHALCTMHLAYMLA